MWNVPDFNEKMIRVKYSIDTGSYHGVAMDYQTASSSMRVTVFASGSSGNCALISAGETRLLIDAGISMKRITAFLLGEGVRWTDIAGILVTHEHADHILALPMIAKYHAVPIYAPHTVANRLSGRYPKLEAQLRIIPVGEGFSIGDTIVTAFHTPHDTDESVGYRLDCGAYSFALATDMGHVTDEIRSALRGCGTVLIEANHDEDMLVNGPYPLPLKRRILSERGHLSNVNAARLASELIKHGTSRIILGHLSQENNLPELALGTVAAVLTDRDIDLLCAPPLGPLAADVEPVRESEAVPC